MPPLGSGKSGNSARRSPIGSWRGTLKLFEFKA
jgi:hypothetical protein